MKYSQRIRNGATYIASADMKLEDEDLVMEWAHTLSTDYRYIQLPPWQRRNYLKKRLIYDAVMEEQAEQPRSIRLALAFRQYLMEKEIRLEDDLLAGSYQFSDHIYTHPFDEQDELECLMDGAAEANLSYDKEELGVFLDYVRCGFCTKNPSGHLVPNYPHLLETGWDGILKEVRKGREKDPSSAFYKACEISVEAGQAYIQRYVDLAQQRGLTCMSEACAHVMHQPPRTFYEAVQLIALTHELAITEQLSGSISFGRFDAYVTPYYERDLAAGILNEDEASQIVEAFFAKVARNRLAYQNLTLGGYNEAGDGFLPWSVTRMCLRASMKLHKDEPMLTFRWNKYMPDELWEEVLASIRSGTGFPALFNDEIVMQAKRNVGLSPEDALRYGMIGCVEICAPGKEFSHAEGLRFNWAKVMEIVLNGGRDTLNDTRFPMKAPRDLSGFESFEEFYSWFKEEFLYTFDRMLKVLDLAEAYYPHQWPLSFTSSIMADCLDKGLDVTAGGTRYNNTAINNNSMANLGDSLQAIRKCVFEQKLFTLTELAHMVNCNFEGYDAQRQQIQSNIIRYGNGKNDSESYLVDISNMLYEHVKERRNCRGGHYQLGYYSVWGQAAFGIQTGALPDGRLQKTPLANSMAPVQGSEKEGPTAIAVSATRLNHTTFGNGMVLDYKFSPAFFDTEAHRAAFKSLVEGYFRLGGMELQFNVVNKETLIDAQLHPENHENLLVRVSGYSAFFNDLAKIVQDEIIMRTEFV